MMPPSRNLIVGVSVAIIVATKRAVFGEMALRSK